MARFTVKGADKQSGYDISPLKVIVIAVCAMGLSAVVYQGTLFVLILLDPLSTVSEGDKSTISIKPDFADAYSKMGDALYDLGRHEEAISANKSAISMRLTRSAPRPTPKKQTEPTKLDTT